jgi:hypothetical protein
MKTFISIAHIQQTMSDNFKKGQTVTDQLRNGIWRTLFANSLTQI